MLGMCLCRVALICTSYLISYKTQHVLFLVQYVNGISCSSVYSPRNFSAFRLNTSRSKILWKPDKYFTVENSARSCSSEYCENVTNFFSELMPRATIAGSSCSIPRLTASDCKERGSSSIVSVKSLGHPELQL